ncbi:GntR family transcriptional regulator [Pseudarthrobacter sp. RMG13]|uniref:GntR family transcriptional regulator n=1 Tax=Pseudarthrobacter humi TaxID=2952523 RepID=A0ABT1LMJ8_9MICC|nr:GntR family transcriptional regulator [Pseudarthrobacter humi]MCP8999677.1 GntR family transcriptional regulator [Pseudarthrobacter humi]
MGNLNDSTYERIWGLVLEGELLPGDRLDERILAARLQVSRTPVREAINRLVQDRIVARIPYKGNTIVALSRKNISDVYVTRQELEGLAVKLALPRMSDLDIQHCAELVRQCDEALENGDLVAYGDFDRQLHEFIVTKSENTAVEHMLSLLSRQIQMVRAIGNRQPHIAEDAAVNRHLFLEALQTRNPERASELLKKHIDDVRLSVIANITD